MQISAMQRRSSSSRTGKHLQPLKPNCYQHNTHYWGCAPSGKIVLHDLIYHIFSLLICFWWIWSNIIIRFTRQSPVWAPFPMKGKAIFIYAKKYDDILLYLYYIILFYIESGTKIISQSISSLLLFSLSTLGSQLIDQSWPAMK